MGVKAGEWEPNAPHLAGHSLPSPTRYLRHRPDIYTLQLFQGMLLKAWVEHLAEKDAKAHSPEQGQRVLGILMILVRPIMDLLT